MSRKYSVLVQKGVLLKSEDKTILFDPIGVAETRPDLIVVSHAHRDHFSTRVLKEYADVPKIMSKATRAFIDPYNKLSNVIEVEHGTQIDVDGVSIEVFNAGHIIGSIQVRIDLGDRLFVYTGDINTEKRLILEPGEIVKGDVLLIEATYAIEKYIFPPRRELYRRVVENVKARLEEEKPVAVMGRKIGVAQELVALLNMSLSIPPVVESELVHVNEVYEAFGVHLGKYIIADEAKSAPLPYVLKLSRKKRFPGEKIPCTGWMINGRGVPLSSHSDFSRLTEYVLESSPQVVVPVYGYRREFASFLRDELGFSSYGDDKVELLV